MLLVLTASTANRSICTGSAAWSCLEAGTGLGPKMLCTFSQQIQPQTRPGPKKALRRSLCVHSAKKSKAQTEPFRRPGSAWALRRSLCVHSANKSKVYSPKHKVFGGRGRPGPKNALRRSLCGHSANYSKVYSPKQSIFGGRCRPGCQKAPQTQPVHRLGQQFQGLRPQPKPFWRSGPVWAKTDS